MRKNLESPILAKQKNVLKQIIEAMAIGKDVSMLFPNVIKCILTNDLELKKLVYMYINHHAQSRPDIVILAVGSFIQVSKLIYSNVFYHLMECTIITKGQYQLQSFGKSISHSHNGLYSSPTNCRIFLSSS